MEGVFTMVNERSSVIEALNDQLNQEFYSYYMYLAMSAHCNNEGLLGFAHWLRVQADEEMLHVNKFYDYILSRNGKVVLKAIDAPPATWSSMLDVFKEGLKHEMFITGCINELVDKSMTAKDHATTAFLQWFVTEQVEEESSFNDILSSLKLINGEGNGLLMLDRELQTRAAASTTSTTSTDTTAA